MDTHIPENIVALGEFLEAHGLTLTRDESPPKSMDFRQIEYADSGIGVRFIHDRGHWDIRIADFTTPTEWYFVSLFSYLFPGKPQPRMTFENALEFTQKHWSQIIIRFNPSHRTATHVQLQAARKERANALFAHIWPTVIVEFEAFLKGKGLHCERRKESKDIYDSKMFHYSNAQIGVRVSSEGGWNVHFADVVADPSHWYRFRAMRKLLQWPVDEKIPFLKMFAFIETNWDEILRRFQDPEGEETRRKLAQFDDG